MLEETGYVQYGIVRVFRFVPGRSHRRAVVGRHVGCMDQTARLETFSDGVFAIAATLLTP